MQETAKAALKASLEKEQQATQQVREQLQGTEASQASLRASLEAVNAEKAASEGRVQRLQTEVQHLQQASCDA